MAKTLKFTHRGKPITLKGFHPSPLSLNNISAKQMIKSIHGNDIWAYVILDTPKSAPVAPTPEEAIPEDIHHLLVQYADIF